MLLETDLVTWLATPLMPKAGQKDSVCKLQIAVFAICHQITIIASLADCRASRKHKGRRGKVEGRQSLTQHSAYYRETAIYLHSMPWASYCITSASCTLTMRMRMVQKAPGTKLCGHILMVNDPNNTHVTLKHVLRI